MIYNYTASDSQGILQEGEIEAASEEAVLDFIKRQGWQAIRVAPKNEAKIPFAGFIFGRLSIDDKIVFTRHLATMLRAGIPIIEAIDILIADAEKPILAKIFSQIRYELQRGQPLSAAFEKFPKDFPLLFVSLVKAGEASGNLEQVFAELSSQMKSEYSLKRRVKSAMIYPSILIIMAFGVLTLMFTVVLPRLTKTFKETGVKLPAITQVLVNISDFITAYPLYIAIFVIGLIFSAVLVWRSSAGKKFLYEKIFFHLPVASDLIKKVSLARSTRVLATLLKSAVPFLDSLRITADTIGNDLYKSAYLKSAESGVARGITLAAMLKREPKLFPHLVTNMIGVGERSGNLEEILVSLSEFYEEEVDNSLKNLVSLIEPVLLLVIGLIIGGIAVSIIVPIYQLVGSFR
ncbi:MAG: type II secretion system F family protein [Parcubacteria group bacterium]|nr:type II secretion system F family protein [Parcubacteria group bacterium]